MKKIHILVADDDKAIRLVLETALKRSGFDVTLTENAAGLWTHAQQNFADLIITDVVMPDANAFELIPKIKEMNNNIPIIVMSAQNTLMTAIKANELGAFEYIPKPFDISELLNIVNRSVNENKKVIENENFESPDGFPLIGRSKPMQEVYRIMARLMNSDLTVLITGESGTGKELVARAIYEHSERAEKKLISLNMADIPIELLESELFGYEKGAFTGAEKKKIGRFEQAHKATLFLDEIGDMPYETQTRILRVLSSGEFYRIGGSEPITVDVRIIAATNQNLNEKVKTGAFREDLFHRLNVIRIPMPSLRDRKEDIPLLAAYFFEKFSKETKSETKILTQEVIDLFSNLIWPGNVLQLQNLCHSLTVLSSAQEINISDLPNDLLIQKKGPELSWLSLIHI